MLRWCARILPVTVLGLLGLALAGWLPHHLWVLAVLANLALGATAGKPVAAIFSRISSREGEFQQYARALELLEARLGDEDPRLARLGREIAGSRSRNRRAGGAAGWMVRLHRLVALSDVRYSGSLHAPLMGLLLWDFHVLAALERWQREVGRPGSGSPPSAR